MSTLDDLGVYLATACSWTMGTDLFADAMPPEPDVLTVLYDSTSAGPTDTMGGPSLPALITPRVQILGRAGTADVARARVRAAYDALAVVADLIVGAVRYARITPVQEPFLMHNDESNRSVFACNFDVVRTPE